jgi:predicted transcriptional regulator
MSTTTLRLPDALKSRIDKLAASSGKSAHAFMVDTLSESTGRIEQQRAFDAEVAERWKKFKATGEYYTLEDIRPYILARARGEGPARPRPRVKSAEELALLRASDRKLGGG